MDERAVGRLARLLGVSRPLIQAPMAGVQGHALAVAVSRAGALGSLPAAMLSPEALRGELQALDTALRQDGATPRFNLNAFCHAAPAGDVARELAWHAALQPYADELGVALPPPGAAPARAPFSTALADLVEPWRPPVMSFHFGLPEPALLARVKAWGAVVMSSATTVDEAVWLEARGADVVIAQGLEAGGHRGHFLSDELDRQAGLFALLPAVVRAVRVPVVAAGGIASPEAVAAALALGAAGVQVGSAYLRADEATTSALHRQALAEPSAASTALTRLFTGRPARGIVNRLMRELGPMHPAAPAFPLATAALAPLRAAAEARGRTDFTPLWAGQSAAGCPARPAAEITRRLLEGFGPAGRPAEH